MEGREEILVLQLTAVQKTRKNSMFCIEQTYIYGKKNCSATGFIDFNYIFMSIVILSWQLDNSTFTAKLFFSFAIWQLLGFFFSSINLMRLEIKIMALIAFFNNQFLTLKTQEHLSSSLEDLVPGPSRGMQQTTCCQTGSLHICCNLLRSKKDV